VLPDWPEPRRPRKVRKGFLLHGVVRFHAGWTAEFVHFDTTAVRGPTPFARWRKTVRTRVEPWLDECERELPGTAVYPLRVRAHWHAKVLLALLFAGEGFFLVQGWAGIPMANRIAFLTALTFMPSVVMRLAAMLRVHSRYSVTVRFSDERNDGAEVDSSIVQYLVEEYTVRWPGRFGVGLYHLTFHYDVEFREINPPRSSFWRMRTLLRKPLRPSDEPERDVRVHRLLGSLVAVRYDPFLLITLIERDAGITSRQFGQRALNRLAAGIGTLVGTAIAIFFQTHTAGMRLGIGAVGLLLFFWLRARWRSDLHRFSQIRFRPRIPADLLREPCVLYLRPHSGDPDRPSPWRDTLDLDLKDVLSGVGLFRVGYRQDTPPPPEDLARLPLPADGWRTVLAMALPECDLVAVPTTGTGPETLWQLTEAVRLLPPSRLLLLIPSGIADEEYARFRRAATEAFAERRAAFPEADRANFRFPDLPAEPPDPAPPGFEPALRGAIHFADDWTPATVSFTPLDAPFVEVPRHTQLQRMRTELKPILASLATEPLFNPHEHRRPVAAG
jgi:hypothetical protein